MVLGLSLQQLQKVSGLHALQLHLPVHVDLLIEGDIYQAGTVAALFAGVLAWEMGARRERPRLSPGVRRRTGTRHQSLLILVMSGIKEAAVRMQGVGNRMSERKACSFLPRHTSTFQVTACFPTPSIYCGVLESEPTALYMPALPPSNTLSPLSL